MFFKAFLVDAMLAAQGAASPAALERRVTWVLFERTSKEAADDRS